MLHSSLFCTINESQINVCQFALPSGMNMMFVVMSLNAMHLLCLGDNHLTVMKYKLRPTI